MVSGMELVRVHHLFGIGNLNNSTSPRNKAPSMGIKYLGPLVIRYVILEPDKESSWVGAGEPFGEGGSL